MLVAVDTNILFDHALENADVIEAISIIRARLENVRLIVTPTVLHELAWAADHEREFEAKETSLKALSNLHQWGYEPLNVVPVGNGIVEQISFRLRTAGICLMRKKMTLRSLQKLHSLAVRFCLRLIHTFSTHKATPISGRR